MIILVTLTYFVTLEPPAHPTSAGRHFQPYVPCLKETQLSRQRSFKPATLMFFYIIFNSFAKQNKNTKK